MSEKRRVGVLPRALIVGAVVIGGYVAWVGTTFGWTMAELWAIWAGCMVALPFVLYLAVTWILKGRNRA